MALLHRCTSWISGLSNTSQNAIVTCLSATAVPGLSLLSPTALAATNMISMATQLGSQVWVSFVAGPTMFVNMEKKAFGDLQSRLFPKFGMVGVSTGIIGLASYHIAHPTVDNLTMLLGCSAIIQLLNSWLVFPVTTKYMYERRKYEEGTEEYKKASMKFGINHGISNLINLACLTANLAYFCMLAASVAVTW